MSPRHATGDTIVVVQVIEVVYGKDTRGGEGARRRAALPTAWPVPEVDHHALHRISLTQRSDFQAHEHLDVLVLPAASPQIAQRLTVSSTDDGALVLADRLAGAALVVPSGWGRLRCNQLEHSHDHSWYAELIVNATRVRSPTSGTLFPGAPTFERDLRQPIERRRQPWARR